MLKKRMIFTLLYDNGSFMLSRNFRLQKVGDLRWLQKNYNFSTVAFSIDELIVLDVTRGTRDIRKFCDHLEAITEGCFAPIAAGGGVRSVEDAKALLRSGADKVVINTPVFDMSDLVNDLAVAFGQQCLVASLDIGRSERNRYQLWTANGTRLVEGELGDWLERINALPIGEIYLNSIERDGTGQGFDFQMLEHLPESFSIPVILAGGAGKFQHLADGLSDMRVDAVATAHLFNFLGDGLRMARQGLVKDGFQLAEWVSERSL